MSKKIILGLVLVSALAACQRREPEINVYTPMDGAVTPQPDFQSQYEN